MNPICDSLRQQRQQLQTMLTDRQRDRYNLQTRIAIAELRATNADPGGTATIDPITATARLARLWVLNATQTTLLGAPLGWVVNAIAAYTELMGLYGQMVPILKDISEYTRALSDLEARIQAEGC